MHVFGRCIGNDETVTETLERSVDVDGVFVEALPHTVAKISTLVLQNTFRGSGAVLKQELRRGYHGQSYKSQFED